MDSLFRAPRTPLGQVTVQGHQKGRADRRKGLPRFLKPLVSTHVKLLPLWPGWMTEYAFALFSWLPEPAFAWLQRQGLPKRVRTPSASASLARG